MSYESDAEEADKCGMTYGKWISIYKPVTPPTMSQIYANIKNGKQCIVCGKWFIAARANTRVCSPDCRAKRDSDMRRRYERGRAKRDRSKKLKEAT